MYLSGYLTGHKYMTGYTTRKEFNRSLPGLLNKLRFVEWSFCLQHAMFLQRSTSESLENVFITAHSDWHAYCNILHVVRYVAECNRHADLVCSVNLFPDFLACFKETPCTNYNENSVYCYLKGDYKPYLPKRTPFQNGVDRWPNLWKVPRRRWISHTYLKWLWGHS
jgi:hypothetical protein